MKLDRMLYNRLQWFNNRELNGMTSLSRRKNSKLVIGPYSLTQNSKISRENLVLIGLDPMKYKKSLTMVLFELKQLMKKKLHFLSMVIG